MTTEQARRHPAYQAACRYARSVGLTGGMDDMDYGITVLAYLHGYDNAKRANPKNRKK